MVENFTVTDVKELYCVISNDHEAFDIGLDVFSTTDRHLVQVGQRVSLEEIDDGQYRIWIDRTDGPFTQEEIDRAMAWAEETKKALGW